LRAWPDRRRGPAQREDRTPVRRRGHPTRRPPARTVTRLLVLQDPGGHQSPGVLVRPGRPLDGSQPVLSGTSDVGRAVNGVLGAPSSHAAVRRAWSLIHSDRGSQRRARGFRAVLSAEGLQGSMGRVAAAGDNVAMDSFNSLLHENVLDRRRWRSRDELHDAVVHRVEHTDDHWGAPAPPTPPRQADPRRGRARLRRLAAPAA
jgi:hypothetical protein